MTDNPSTQRKNTSPSHQAPQVIPHSNEAEQAVLGSILLNNQSWDVVAETVTEKDFYTRQHRLIFQAIASLFRENKPVDVLTLEVALKNKQQLEDVGGFAYLADIANNTPKLANVKAYAEIVKDNGILRELLSVSHRIAEQCYDRKGQEVKEILDVAERTVLEISQHRMGADEGPKNILPVLYQTIERIEQLSKSKHNGGITGVSTGYVDLDQKTAGLQKSDLIIVAARPSMGKTTFAMNLCENIAMNAEKPVLVFSLEMPAEQIMMRLLASLSRIDQTKIRTGQLSQEDHARLSQTLGLLNQKPNLFIDDSSGLTPTELRSRARRLYREHEGLSMIMVDYLQLMRVPGFSENRTLEIAEISRSLKALAKELNVPVIALSQLNRTLENRPNKRPQNSDLRESGAIEQDADVIMFIYRDEVYNPETEDKGVAEIIIGKQRNGPIGKVKLTFLGQYSRFENHSSSPAYMGSHH